MNAPALSIDEDRVVAAFVRVLGDAAREQWMAACAAVPLQPPCAQTPEHLVAVLRLLSGEEGVIRVIALGQLVRVRTAMAREVPV